MGGCPRRDTGQAGPGGPSSLLFLALTRGTGSISLGPSSLYPPPPHPPPPPVNLTMALGLPLSPQVPAQTPSTTREKMISSKALATLLTPIRMAGTMAKTLLISKAPFLQGQQGPEGRGLRGQKQSLPACCPSSHHSGSGKRPRGAGGWEEGEGSGRWTRVPRREVWVGRGGVGSSQLGLAENGREGRRGGLPSQAGRFLSLVPCQQGPDEVKVVRGVTRRSPRQEGCRARLAGLSDPCQAEHP